MQATRSRIGLSLGLAAALLGAGCREGAKADRPAEDKVVTLTYANFPPPSTFPCVQMERWAREVEQRSGGQAKVQTFPGGTLVGAKEMFDAVVSGTADIGNLAMSYQPGRFPLSEAVDLPHFFPDARTASMVLCDLIEKYQPAEFEKVKVLTVFTCPPATVMSSREIAGLAGLKGLELRVSGTGAEVMRRLGAVPVAMPQSEAPEAIQKGVVKGMVSSMEVLKDMNYAAYCPYALDLDLNVISFAVVMNRARYEALPLAVREAMDGLYREQAEWTGRYVDEHVQEALAWAASTKDHRLSALSATDMEQVRALLEPMVTDYITRVTAAGLPGEAIIRDLREFQAKYSSAAP